MTITNPLRLAVGSHEAGSGKFCAMNVISWENGDTIITDFPECSDGLLTHITQRINDQICTHRDGDLLCPECSLIVLKLSHRTVGTGTLGLTDTERRVIWVRIAADQARQVQHLTINPHVEDVIAAAENWADNPTDDAAFDARVLCYFSSNNAALAAQFAARAAWISTASSASAASSASSAASSSSAYAAEASGDSLSLANRAIDLFEQLTSHVAPAPDEAVTRKALEKMFT